MMRTLKFRRASATLTQMTWFSCVELGNSFGHLADRLVELPVKIDPLLAVGPIHAEPDRSLVQLSWLA